MDRPDRRKLTAVIVLVVGVAAVLVGWVASRVAGETEPAAKAFDPYSCSAGAEPHLSAVEHAVVAAAKADQVSVELIGQVGSCDSGSGRAIEADFAPDLGTAEQFIRDHFTCGRTKRHDAVPADVEKQYHWNLEPTRILNCTVGGEPTQVAVYDEADWDESLAGINITLARDL